MALIDKKWAHVRLPVSESITARQAEDLMVQYLRMRDDWTDQYVNALYYQDKSEFRYDSAYQIAFLKAGAQASDGEGGPIIKTTEKSKDITARSDPSVLAARLDLIRAKAATVEAKTKLEGCTLAHHAAKRILEQASEDRYL